MAHLARERRGFFFAFLLFAYGSSSFTPASADVPIYLQNPFQSSLKIIPIYNQPDLSDLSNITIFEFKLEDTAPSPYEGTGYTHSPYEEIQIRRIKFTQTGSARDNDYSNIRLINSDTGYVYQSIPAAANGIIEFNLDVDGSEPDYGVLVSWHTYKVVAAIASSAAGKKIGLKIRRAADIDAFDYRNDARVALISKQLNRFAISGEKISFPLPSLVLIKTVINNNGGAKKVKDFRLFVDGETVKSGKRKILTPGEHFASEETLPNYDASAWGGDCALDGSITLSLGQHAVCTITNDDAAPLPSVVIDNFNGYTPGSIVGQGGWNDRVNGTNFIVQGAVVFEGSGAIYNNNQADSVVTKLGTPLSNGKQAVYVRTENRSEWGLYEDGNAQVRILKGSWDSASMAAVSFKSDGHAAYYDSAADDYINFASYNDGEWTLLEIEWRSSDKTARYRINSGAWTDRKAFRGGSSFADFDTVGFDFISPGGLGGVYFDNLH